MAGIIILLLLLLRLLGLLSQVSSPRYFTPPTNSYPHRSRFMFQSATLSVLCAMFQVQLSGLLNIFHDLPFICQTAVVSARKLTLTELNWTWNILIILLKILQYICILVLFIQLFTHQLSFSSTNSTEHNSTLYVRRKTIISQISFSKL